MARRSVARKVARNQGIRQFDGRYADLDCKESWQRPKSAKCLNPIGHVSRYYDWKRFIVVENVGFDDVYVRKMTSEERSATLVDSVTGAKYESPVAYSTATSCVYLPVLDGFGLPSGGVESITATCHIAFDGDRNGEAWKPSRPADRSG